MSRQELIRPDGKAAWREWIFRSVRANHSPNHVTDDGRLRQCFGCREPRRKLMAGIWGQGVEASVSFARLLARHRRMQGNAPSFLTRHQKSVVGGRRGVLAESRPFHSKLR